MHYFVSDIHLGSGKRAERRRVESQFLDFLKQIENDCETLFLVGDIFDFWFEYKEVVPKGFVRILGRLAELHDKGVRVVMLTGNHDMWCYDYLQKECGIEIHFTPQHYTLSGHNLFIAHGDNMNIKDKPLLRVMNACFRSRVLRALFSWLVHPDLFLRFGQWWSGSSRKSHGEERDVKFLQPLVEYADRYAESHPTFDGFIFGHMHYAADVTTEQRVLFMGDWHKQPSYIALDDNGNIELKIN